MCEPKRYVGLLLLTMFLLLFFGGFRRSSSHAAEKPNIIVFLADDLGIDCVESYGGLSYKTPNIDQLASSGIRFTHCFANPYCTPSRAQLLTGRYPLHNGMPRVIFLPEKHREYLDPGRETTVAKLLKGVGYATAAAGKWQLSFLHERDIIQEHGFDEYQCWQIFHEGEKTSRYANPTLRQNGKVLSNELVGTYGPDENLAFIIDFIERHQQQPFFVYYACLLPHWPWEPTPESGEPLKPASGLGEFRYMTDMVSYLDKQVGAITMALDRLGIRENTLVLFVADNGTDQRLVTKWSDGVNIREIPGGKAKMTDTGSRVPLIASWPGTIEPSQVNEELIDLSDILPTIVELAGAKSPLQPLNGISFLPQLLGQEGQTRSWVHVQMDKLRHVRGRHYILNNGGEFRPVAEYGTGPAAPISPQSNSEAHEEFVHLTSAMHEAETFKEMKPADGDR